MWSARCGWAAAARQLYCPMALAPGGAPRMGEEPGGSEGLAPCPDTKHPGRRRARERGGTLPPP
eukprot:scaffold172844_cov31-Tisochrysis_lutea.AAC.6